jgi:hypothetical protein
MDFGKDKNQPQKGKIKNIKDGTHNKTVQDSCPRYGDVNRV